MTYESLVIEFTRSLMLLTYKTILLIETYLLMVESMSAILTTTLDLIQESFALVSNKIVGNVYSKTCLFRSSDEIFLAE